jgi:hypothetical protein
MSGAPTSDLAAVLEHCRAHRAALVRHLPLPPDSLHRVLRCTRCQQWNLDTRVYEGFLQVGDGGQRPCWSLDELRAFAESQHRALHRVDRLDPCRCGAPAISLSMTAARFLHAMPGSGAELVVEVHYVDERAVAVRFGRGVLGGAVSFFEDATEEAIHAVFGVPLTVWGAWRRVVASEDGGVAALEEGLALAAFPLGAEGFRAEFEDALRADPELRAYGLSPRVTADPSWQWLRADANLAARPDTVLVMMLRHDVLASRVALLTAARGLGARREGDTVWVEDGLARWPVELPTVAEEGLRRGFSLSTMAAAAVAHALDRVETLRTFIGAIEQMRPGVTFSLDGMNLVPSREGVTGRPIDLRTAPFGAIPDPETLERDLRFYLQEAPAWSDPWRVCPCGAARAVTLHRWHRDDLAELGARSTELAVAGDDPASGDTVRVFSVSCDRHVEHALGPLRAAHPRGLDALAAQAALDLDRQRFVLKVAPYVDAAGRAAALVESAHLLDATAHPALLAGLVASALGRSVAATVTTLSRELAVVAEADVGGELVARLEEVGRVLWTVQRGRPPTPVRAVFVSEAETASAGVFERAENGPAEKLADAGV